MCLDAAEAMSPVVAGTGHSVFSRISQVCLNVWNKDLFTTWKILAVNQHIRLCPSGCIQELFLFASASFFCLEALCSSLRLGELGGKHWQQLSSEAAASKCFVIVCTNEWKE